MYYYEDFFKPLEMMHKENRKRAAVFVDPKQILLQKQLAEDEEEEDFLIHQRMIQIQNDNIEKEGYNSLLVQPGKDLLNIIPNCASILIHNKLKKGYRG